jgi:hypothetical protein
MKALEAVATLKVPSRGKAGAFIRSGLPQDGGDSLTTE